ncbi:MAG: 2-C-methyl-D-erythritol 4-phosphate cytidylyltransferase [Jiangellales bacterium]
MSTAAVVPAAGRGERLGAGGPKALAHLHGEPLIVHSARLLAAAGPVEWVVVAAPPDDVAHVRSVVDQLDLAAAVSVVAGGPTRSRSVLNALMTLGPDVDVVLVHDAARPLTPVGLVESVDAAVRAGLDAVVPGLPVVDTVKRVASDDGVARVVGTVDRAPLRAIQTPQGFRRDVLDRAYASAVADGCLDATDDAGLVERLGVAVAVVPGDEAAFKVTRPLDLVLADAVLTQRAAAHGGLS